MTHQDSNGQHQVPEGYVEFTTYSGYARQFGDLYVKERDNGELVGFRVLAHHLNPHNICHGAAMAYLADLQIIGVRKLLPRRRGFSPTIDLSIDYIAPVPEGVWVEMDTELVKATKTIIFTRATMRVDGKIVATATAKYRMFLQPPDQSNT